MWERCCGGHSVRAEVQTQQGMCAQGCLESCRARSPHLIPTGMGVGKERPPEEQGSIELLPYLSRAREAER